MNSSSADNAMFKTRQDFGQEPTAVRETDHYQHEYVRDFVEHWDDLIDWEGRASSEGDFFIQVLRDYGCKSVIDAATGTGFHSVQLLKAGFEVASIDGSPQMLAKAFENAREQGLILSTVHSDWRWMSRDLVGRYDAIICLGNSFTHIFSEHDRRRTLAEFYSMLKHDGILILDQRNYDALLDGKSKPGHKYYYCGENVTAEPEHIDEGLARFRYEFPDASVFHLNMFPLRQAYVRHLMHEVGFQAVDTYGDFQSSYQEEDPDFFIHVAQKTYRAQDEDASHNQKQAASHKTYSEAVKTAKAYYNSADADNFYSRIWGGQDIHIGLYEDPEDPILDASHRTVERMADTLGDALDNARVLDIGGGYGGSARHLASEHTASVVSLNLSEVQNKRGRRQTVEAGLADRVKIVDGDFENIPYDDDSFDVVWSQDAMLHSGNRERVLEEVARVLKPGGSFIFTDPMQADDCPDGVLQPVLDRIQLETMGSPGFYRRTLTRLGLTEVGFQDHSSQVPIHYDRIRRELDAHAEALRSDISEAYVSNMRKGLQHWVNAGTAGHLAWGIMTFKA